METGERGEDCIALTCQPGQQETEGRGRADQQLAPATEDRETTPAQPPAPHRQSRNNTESWVTQDYCLFKIRGGDAQSLSAWSVVQFIIDVISLAVSPYLWVRPGQGGPRQSACVWPPSPLLPHPRPRQADCPPPTAVWPGPLPGQPAQTAPGLACQSRPVSVCPCLLALDTGHPTPDWHVILPPRLSQLESVPCLQQTSQPRQSNCDPSSQHTCSLQSLQADKPAVISTWTIVIPCT